MDADYVRELINNKAIGGRQSKWPIDLLSLIDAYGTRAVKKNRSRRIFEVLERRYNELYRYNGER